jgi:hypothetical protein
VKEFHFFCFGIISFYEAYAYLLALEPVIIFRITGVSDFIHRPDFNNYKKKNKHDVSETGSVSVLR